MPLSAYSVDCERTIGDAWARLMLCRAGSTASVSTEACRKTDWARTVRTSSVAVIVLAGLRTVVWGGAAVACLLMILNGDVFAAALGVLRGVPWADTAGLVGTRTGLS